MADDLTKRGRADRDRINVHEAHELRCWTEHFSCTADELCAAVKAVGPMARDIAAHLAR